MATGKKRQKKSTRLASKVEEYFEPLSEVEPLSVDWLWYPYIPRHAVTLIAGNSGVGKSFLTMDMVARVTNEARWPHSNEDPNGRRVLIMSAEDDASRAMLPRLLKLRADIDHTHYMKKYHELNDSFFPVVAEKARTWSPDLIIVDTISAYMGDDINMNTQNQVQSFLVRLGEIAQDTDAAVVAIAHLNKKGGESAIHRINGSVGFVAATRSALILADNPQNSRQQILAHLKSNWGPKGPSLILEKTGGDRDTVPSVEWPGFSDQSADDICNPSNRPAHRPTKERAVAGQFIVDYLSENGTVRSTVLQKAAEDAGHSYKTFVRARRDLKEEGEIECNKDKRRSFWRLSSPS